MTDHKNEDHLGEILSQVAYQMKDTMAAMYAALQRVAPSERRDEDAALDENAALLTRNFYRLRRLAGNLEEAAELDAPPCPVTTHDDIVGIVRAVTDRAAFAAEMLGLTLEVRCEVSSRIIAVDADRVERMLLGLLSNAFKFTPRGGTVTVTVLLFGKNVEIRVQDTGCGIPDHRMEEIFERYRYSFLPDGSPTGMGLGLPIARKIAEDHGGSLVVFSREGEGTLAVVSLPDRRSSSVGMGTKIVVDYSGGFNRTLLELSDALPKEAFRNKMID